MSFIKFRIMKENKEKNRVRKAFRFIFTGGGHLYLRWLLAYRLNTLNETEVVELLSKVDVTDPQKRCRNVYDGYYKKLLPCLYKYGEALRIINRYGHLADTFFRVLTDIGSNPKWQYKLCEVEVNEFMPQDPYFARYGNLLFGYVRRYDLLPEVKEELFQNPKYKRVVEIYEIARS